MSDSHLRELLRRVSQGDNDAIVSAVNTASRLGLTVADIRQEITDRWVPFYSSINELTRRRTNLALSAYSPSYAAHEFPNKFFFGSHHLLMSGSEWQLYAADCAEHVLSIFESEYPDDKRLQTAIDIARRFALRKATRQELEHAQRETGKVVIFAWERSRLDILRSAEGVLDFANLNQIDSAPSDAAAATLNALFSYDAWEGVWGTLEKASSAARIGRQQYLQERYWQRQRLSDYLVGLSALPPPVTNE